MTGESIAIKILEPILIASVNTLKKRILGSFVAEIIRVTPVTSSIRISNGVAYGSFVFLVKNKRLARWYDKYSIPFLDFFGSDAIWTISDPKYGKINSKNTLQLELDNIPRNQTVMIHVDTSCKVEPTKYIIMNIEPSGIILQENMSECEVEIINNQDFSILGLNIEIDANFIYGNVDILYVKDIGILEKIPQEFIRIIDQEYPNMKKIVWEVDLSPREIKRFRVRLISQ